MKTSTQIEEASLILGEEKAVEYVAKAGFDGWDLHVRNVQIRLAIGQAA